MINKVLKSLYKFDCDGLLLDNFPSMPEDLEIVREELLLEEVFCMLPGEAR